ncbi:DUF7537 family lipoprotein [Halosimplex pelagicum]|uniref:LppX_LprAFG lipoprotein n=1 Tax=Halosimplex pelagicum TaxID=869886 RepID=A0A7D5P8X4_9EURY|nr:hypothetical protein [Halosimplex pelagicum]QLH81704.1 hypothetical protein HZS54_08730 [Halosimplex pelagicum]
MLFRPSAIDGRALGVASVVLLVALAGCGGGGGTDGATASPEPSGPAADADTPTPGEPATGTTADGESGTETPADSDGTPTDSDPTATDSDVTATEGSQGPGETLSDSFVSGWSQRLQSAGSFTAEMRGISVTTSGQMSGESEGQPPVVNWTMKMDLSTGARYANGTISGSGESIPIELYHPPSSDTTYSRTTFQGQSRISQSTNTADRDNPVSEGLLHAVRLTRAGTETVDGETLQRYTAADADAVVNRSYFGGSVSDLRMDVLVDADAGVVRVIDYEYEVESDDDTTTQFLRIRYTDIGTTTVERPDWMSQTGG